VAAADVSRGNALESATIFSSVDTAALVLEGNASMADRYKTNQKLLRRGFTAMRAAVPHDGSKIAVIFLCNSKANGDQ